MSEKVFVDKVTVMMRFFREATGKSQSEIAELLNIGLRSYQRYESGESIPSIDIIYNLSRALNFELKDMFSPELKNELVPDFKIYKGEEEKLFLQDPEVVTSKLMEIFNSPLYQKSLESGDFKIMKESPEFMNSPFCLAISQPRNTLLNTASTKVGGAHSDIVTTTSGHGDLKKLAMVWGLFMDSPVCYFEDITYPTFPKGKVKMRVKGIFSSFNGNYQILSFNDVTIIGKKTR